jgi:hypothetical protein
VEVDPEHELCRRRALVALETMEEDAAVMVDHADLSTRALWLLIQAKLAAVSDPERGETAYQEAVRALDEAGHVVARALVEPSAVRSRDPALIGG